MYVETDTKLFKPNEEIARAIFDSKQAELSTAIFLYYREDDADNDGQIPEYTIRVDTKGLVARLHYNNYKMAIEAFKKLCIPVLANF